MHRTSVAALAAAASLGLAATASASVSVTQSFSQNAHVEVRTSATGCSNNPGPYITIDGSMGLGGVKARIILTNNERWTHVASDDVIADVDIAPAGQNLTFHKQPSQGGVGGNPWIYFQLNNCKGTTLSNPLLLGRCVQGLSPTALDFLLPTNATCRVSSDVCSNSPGPYVTLDGELRLGGVGGTLILTNNAKFTHAASGDVVIDIVLIPEGQSITFHKQPPAGGAGGNPIIYVQFLNGSGSPVGDPIKLGRCNKI